MRCLTAEDVRIRFASIGFDVPLQDDHSGQPLVLRPDIASRQKRIGEEVVIDVRRLPMFIAAVNSWLPSGCGRLFWLDNWSDDYPSVYSSFLTSRIGLKETRSIVDAPGHLFDPNPYGEQDQTCIGSRQSFEVGILVGFIAFVIADGWDAWLIADDGCSDRIEFWEGNIFFYSDDAYRISEAKSILTDYIAKKGT